MTLDEVAALEALHARVAQGPWATDRAHMDVLIRPGVGHVPVADCHFAHNYPGRTHAQDRANAALIAAARNALPGLLALARRALEADSARARWEAALKTVPREPDADDMRDAAAAECRKIADRPPKGSDRAEQELWREACEHCADRVEAMELRVVSRVVLPDAGGAA